MNYFEYETSDETVLYVEWQQDNKGNIINLLIETERGLNASDRRYEEIKEFIYANLLTKPDNLQSAS